MSADAPVLRAQDLRFEYGEGSFELRVDHLAVARGSRTACVGPSGSGKTTLLNLLTGILEPDAGSVELEGRPLGRLDDAARRALRLARVGMVFQHFALLEYLTALDNVLLPYLVSPGQTADEAARERARELARAVGIERLLGRKPARLSQGERQRVALCRALVTEPAVVVADEPTAGLDPVSAAAAIDLLFDVTAASDATLLVVTHDHGVLGRFDAVLDMEVLGRAAPHGEVAT